MPTNPTTPHDTDDEADEEIAMDAVEREADFLADGDPGNYPSVLRITANPEQQHREDALDRVARWEAGEEVPNVVNFQHPSDLRALLTDRRLELLQSVMKDRPDSIRQLAERLERDVKSVHEDLQVLAEYDIVHYEERGRAKRPFIPYETIEVNLQITTSSPADDAAPA